MVPKNNLSDLVKAAGHSWKDWAKSSAVAFGAIAMLWLLGAREDHVMDELSNWTAVAVCVAVLLIVRLVVESSSPAYDRKIRTRVVLMSLAVFGAISWFVGSVGIRAKIERGVDKTISESVRAATADLEKILLAEMSKKDGVIDQLREQIREDRNRLEDRVNEKDDKIMEQVAVIEQLGDKLNEARTANVDAKASRPIVLAQDADTPGNRYVLVTGDREPNGKYYLLIEFGVNAQAMLPGFGVGVGFGEQRFDSSEYWMAPPGCSHPAKCKHEGVNYAIAGSGGEAKNQITVAPGSDSVTKDRSLYLLAYSDAQLNILACFFRAHNESAKTPCKSEMVRFTETRP